MSTHCFKRLLGTFLIGTAFSLAGSTPALADNPAANFELDGNIVNSGSGLPDWSDIFTGNLPSIGAGSKNPLPAGFSTATFISDFFPTNTSDTSLYATGSKDTLNITPGWQCKTTNNVNDKVDINNAYATALTKTGQDGKTHLFVYFGMDVAANDGTKDVGFWFLKDPTVGCVAGNGSTAFTGVHSDGDVLITSEFTNGGRVSTIVAFVWVKPPGDPVGHLNTTPIATGGECDGTNFDVCAKVNSVALNQASGGVPWLVKTKPSNPADPGYTGTKDLDIGEFFEGGIDLTAVGISGCFNRYLADTRSSTSPTATIFDYALGNFSNCSIGATKTCQTATVNTATSDFTSPFKVTITNTSPSGTVYDASFKETYNFGQTGETCTITSVTGTGTAVVDTSGVNTAITSGNTVRVASQLSSNDSVVVGISCTGGLNSFQDSIHAVAGSSPGLSDISKDAQVGSTDATACQATVTGGLTITKACKGMTLQGSLTDNTAPITLNANVEVTVTNPSTSNENVTITSLSDPKVGGSGTIGNFVQMKCDLSATLSDLVLSPGETACFVGHYTPKTSDLTNPPSTAAFNDTATVTGAGAISGTFPAVGDPTISATATCFLCDFDVDGHPDINDAFPNDPTKF